jgi:hypothetical protein
LYLNAHLDSKAADYVAPVFGDIVFPFGGLPENAVTPGKAPPPDYEKMKAHAAYVTAAMGGYVDPKVAKITREEALQKLK